MIARLRITQPLKPALALTTALVIALSGTGCASPQVRAETIFVSPAGNDANDGSAPQGRLGGSGPVRTLTRAQAIAQAVRARPSAPPVGIELAGGTYRLERPLVLQSKDSGRPGAPLRIYGAAGARVVISGGVPISGWVRGQASELTAKINLAAFGGTCPNQLFVNGARRYRPRLPKVGTFAIAAAGAPEQPGVSAPLQFTARAGDLPSGFKVSPETEIVIIDAWTATRLRVPGFSPKTGTLTVQGEYRGRKSRASFEPGLPYYIENQLVAQLDPGEWQCSAEAAQVRYRPVVGEEANALAAVAPMLQNLVVVRGTRDDPVHDIAIESVTFEHAGWTLPTAGWAAMQSEIGLPAAIQADNCRAITFRKVGIARSGAQGIAITRNCQDIEVADSQLTDLGGGGIMIGSAQRAPAAGSDWEVWAKARAPTSNVHIKRNTLRSLGRMHLAGTGIWVGQADHVAIIGNRISDLYYTGISVGWNWNNNPSPVHDNLISENRIEDFGQGLLSDMGGIYTLGRQDGTVVERNVIVNGVARTYGGWGLYADRGSTGIAFANNAIGKTSADPMFVHEAGALSISGNHKLGDKSDTLVCSPPKAVFVSGMSGMTYACNFNSGKALPYRIK